MDSQQTCFLSLLELLLEKCRIWTLDKKAIMGTNLFLIYLGDYSANFNDSKAIWNPFGQIVEVHWLFSPEGFQRAHGAYHLWDPIYAGEYWADFLIYNI